MTTNQLITALRILKHLKPHNEITAIKFEDGSGNKFIYQIDGLDRWHYEDLTLYIGIAELFV